MSTGYRSKMLSVILYGPPRGPVIKKNLNIADPHLVRASRPTKRRSVKNWGSNPDGGDYRWFGVQNYVAE